MLGEGHALAETGRLASPAASRGRELSSCRRPRPVPPSHYRRTRHALCLDVCGGVRVCVRVRVRACVRACLLACVRACGRVHVHVRVCVCMRARAPRWTSAGGRADAAGTRRARWRGWGTCTGWA